MLLIHLTTSLPRRTKPKHLIPIIRIQSSQAYLLKQRKRRSSKKYRCMPLFFLTFYTYLSVYLSSSLPSFLFLSLFFSIGVRCRRRVQKLERILAYSCVKVDYRLRHCERQNGRGTCFQVTICPAWMVTAPRENPRADAVLPRPGQAVIVTMSITVSRDIGAAPRPASQICLTICRPHRTARTVVSWTLLRAYPELRTTITFTTMYQPSTWTKAIPHLA